MATKTRLRENKLHKTWTYNGHGDRFGYDQVTGKLYHNLDEYECSDVIGVRCMAHTQTVSIQFESSTLVLCISDGLYDEFAEWAHRVIEVHHKNLINEADIGMSTYAPAQKKPEIDLLLYRGGRKSMVLVQYQDSAITNTIHDCANTTSRRLFKEHVLQQEYCMNAEARKSSKINALKRNDLAPRTSIFNRKL